MAMAPRVLVALHTSEGQTANYECRTVTTDPASRQKFMRYWTVIRPFVAHIFRATVRTIRDNAEQQPI